MSFLAFLDASKKHISPDQQAAYNALVENFKQFPQVISEGDKTILLHKDYSRVIQELRANPLTAKLPNGDELIISQSNQNGTQGDQYKARYDELVDKLKAYDVAELFVVEDPATLPALAASDQTLPNEEDGTMKVEMNPEEYAKFTAFLQQSAAPAPAPAPVTSPVSAPAPATDQYITQAMFEQAMQKQALISAQIPLVLNQFADELKVLTNAPVDVAALGRDWTASGKPFEQYIEETYKYSELSAAHQQKEFESKVEAKAMELLAAKAAGGSPVGSMASATGNNPLFNSISQAPAGVRQSAPAAPQQQSQQQTSPAPATAPSAPNGTPNTNNFTAHETGVMAAAQALLSGNHTNEQFNPVRQ